MPCVRAKVLATLGTTAERLVEQADNSCVVCLGAMVANVALTPCGARRGASASKFTLVAERWPGPQGMWASATRARES